MGGSADITQVGLPHAMQAVGRGGDLVGICTAFDIYPIALVISNAAIKRLASPRPCRSTRSSSGCTA